MTTVDELLAIEEIKQLKARYFRCVDTKDWEGFAQVFALDAVMRVSWTDTEDGGGEIHGNRAIADYVGSQIQEITSVHHGHMPEIEITSPRRAQGVWAMEDMLWFPEGGPIRSMHGYGHYHETYEKVDNDWRIATFELTRLRVDMDA